jgi:hypothetical protein
MQSINDHHKCRAQTTIINAESKSITINAPGVEREREWGGAAGGQNEGGEWPLVKSLERKIRTSLAHWVICGPNVFQSLLLATMQDTLGGTFNGAQIRRRSMKISGFFLPFMLIQRIKLQRKKGLTTFFSVSH